MNIYGYILSCFFFLLLQWRSEASDKWSWGTDNDKKSVEEIPSVSPKEEIVPRSASPDISHATDESSEQLFQGSRAAEGTGVKPALPEARTFGKFFKKLGCRFGLGCDDLQHPPPYPVPPYPGPVPFPIPIGPVPFAPQIPYPGPVPFAPQIPYPGPVSAPLISPIPQPSLTYPQQVPTKIGYPPIQKPIVAEHIHTHTHIHKGIDDHSVESPYKHTGYPPKPGFSPVALNGGYPPKPGFSPTIINSGYPSKTGFSPTIINGGSSHLDSHESGVGSFHTIGNKNDYGIKPIAVQPEAVTGTLYRPAKSLYTEECSCVLPEYCTSYDIVRKHLGKDIVHLVNPRNEAISVLSNATDDKRFLRSKRDTMITNRQPVAANTRTANGRAIGGYPPGLSGCGPGYVCCRSSIQEAKQFDGVCGKSVKSSIHGRIANTEYNRGATQFGEFPWQAALLKDKNYESAFVCGATLVSPRHVLTAAHCIVDEKYHALKVRLGEWDVNSVKEFYKHIELPVQTAIIHPKFYAGNLNNDIAVITLDGYVDFSAYPHIAPVCLPNPYTDYTHQHCYVSGWGKDAFGYSGKFQQILKKVDVPIVDRRSCEYALQEAKLGRDYHLPEGFICAGGEEGKDTCKGDGGGPLVCGTPYNTYQLAGIVSWGIGCGLKGVPGVYVNIPYYVDWIKSIIAY